MNVIYLCFLVGDTNAIYGGVLFCITHAFLSSLLFYTVDCVQKRYHTRSVLELSGIVSSTPNLGVVIFINSVFFAGIPGTLKFLSEIYIFLGLEEQSLSFLILLLLCSNFLGVVGFSKSWFTVLFGATVNLHYIPLDLTSKDFLIIGICYSMLFLLTFFVDLLII